MKKENQNTNSGGQSESVDQGLDSGRRAALKKFGLAAAAFAAPMIVPSRVLAQKTVKSSTPPPSERLNIGLIGLGNAMNEIRSKLEDNDDVFITGVCDVDERRNKATLAELKRKYWKFRNEFSGGFSSQDHRKIISNPEIDGVVIATPVHWHAAIALDAIRAGKDVLIQSPMTLTVREGQLLEQAAAHHGVIVQCIAPYRSEDRIVEACELVCNGYLGDIKEIYLEMNYFNEPEAMPTQEPPADLDYDRWLGPAPYAPFHAARINGSRVGGWRQLWDYGLRKHGQPGFDRYDLIQWALGYEKTGPVEFIPEGVEGQAYATYRYANGTIVKLGHPISEDQEFEFVGTQGSLAFKSKGRLHSDPKEIIKAEIGPGETHLPLEPIVEASWVENIRTRTTPIVNASVGHRSSTICQLNAIAMRTGRKISWDPEKEKITNDALAARMLDRPRRAPYTLA